MTSPAHFLSKPSDSAAHELRATRTIIAAPVAMTFPGRDGADVGRDRDPNVFAPGGIRVFDLNMEALDIALSARREHPEHTGRTIARLDTLRLTLMSLKSGATIKQHKTEHEISIQTVSGHVVLHTTLGQIELPAGSVAVLERYAPHDIVAQGDSSILITVCMSPNPNPSHQ
jgi:quercetin dioxygenase-like cupin family protein